MSHPSKPLRVSSQAKILEAVGQDLRENLLHNHRQLAIPASHQLIFQSDWGSETYVIVEGIAKARSLTLAGEEVVISLMGSGALIGDLALLSPEPIRSVDVVALTAVTLLKLRDGALKEALESSATALALIAGLQAQRLKVLGERLMLMHEDATTRLLATLLELARLNGPADDPHQPIPAISQNEIAVIAGLSRGTTSTLINKMRSNGTLENGVEGLRFATLAPLQRRGLLPTIPPPPG